MRVGILRRTVPWFVAARPSPSPHSRGGVRRRAGVSMFAMVLPDSAKLTEIAGGVASRCRETDRSSRTSEAVAAQTRSTFARSTTRSPRARDGGRLESGLFTRRHMAAVHDEGKLKKVCTAGGSPVLVSDSAAGLADWNDRNEILFVRAGQSGACLRRRRHSVTRRKTGLVPRSHVRCTSCVPRRRGRARHDGHRAGLANGGKLGLVSIPGGKVTDSAKGQSPRYASSGGDCSVWPRWVPVGGAVLPSPSPHHRPGGAARRRSQQSGERGRADRCRRRNDGVCHRNVRNRLAPGFRRPARNERLCRQRGELSVGRAFHRTESTSRSRSGLPLARSMSGSMTSPRTGSLG